MLKILHLLVNILSFKNQHINYLKFYVSYKILCIFVFILENTKYQSLHSQNSDCGWPRQDCDRPAWNGSGKVGLHSPRSLCEESRMLHCTIPGLYLQGMAFPAFTSWNQSLPAIISLNPCSSVGCANPSCHLVPSLCHQQVCFQGWRSFLIPSPSQGNLPFKIILSRGQPDENQGWEAFNMLKLCSDLCEPAAS